MSLSKKSRIFIFCDMFKYGTANTNRHLAFSRGFNEHGYDSVIVAVRIFDIGDYKLEKDLKIRKLFATKIHYFKILRMLISFICVIKFILFDFKQNDKVILCGCINYIPLFVLFKKHNVFHERTECPEIGNPSYLSLKKYYYYCSYLEGLFVISDHLKKFFISVGVEDKKVHIINMIVDDNRFKNITINNQSKKYIGYCGNIFDDNKDGIMQLLEAFVGYHVKYPDRYLYIAGPIYSMCQKNIYDAYLSKNRVSDFVFFLGRISPDMMPDFLANAEMLMLTRPNNIQAHYGFPTKLGEYLLSKRPVIISDVGDINNYLKNKESAIIVNPDVISEFIDSMIWISNNPIEANIIGLNGQKCAKNNFNYMMETKKMIQTMYFN